MLELNVERYLQGVMKGGPYETANALKLSPGNELLNHYGLRVVDPSAIGKVFHVLLKYHSTSAEF